MHTSKEKNDIIVTGYPKSGNTWLTRLIAEVVGCPVAGFLRSEHAEIAIEGSERISDYQCWKAHQQLVELDSEMRTPTTRIVYVVRDPRDVVVSGANFFSFPMRWPFLHRVLRRTPAGLRCYYSLIMNENHRLDLMIDTVLNGCEVTHYWCRIPWETHVRPFIESSVLLVRYEDLLVCPIEECRRICDYVGVGVPDAVLVRAVERQSFSARKTRALALGDGENACFLRSGSASQWRDALSPAQLGRIEKKLHPMLTTLGYECATLK
jgi:hypothetical protein